MRETTMKEQPQKAAHIRRGRAREQTMAVRFTTSVAGARFAYQAGQYVPDMPAHVAQRFIAQGYAEAV